MRQRKNNREKIVRGEYILFSRIIQVISSLLIAAAVNAHPGHGDVVQLDQSSAMEAASSKIEDLIGEGKLDSSWLERAEAKAQLARISGRQNWTVTYVGSESNKRLELVFSMTGNFISFSETTITGIASD